MSVDGPPATDDPGIATREPTPPQHVVDPVTALAVTMQAKPGAFALLLGSGVSRVAQIPTGWEVLKALIVRVAVCAGEPEPLDPEVWYQERFGEAPVYGTILERLGAGEAERSEIMRRFIEPTPEERADGLKQPTEAHRAIADLVAGGYVRVIVTTNFDRLLEQALETVGVTPSVIATTDAILRTLPLAHNVCTIIKVNGDFGDARIKNTLIELDEYDPELKALLTQVFREYGTLVCGWSADWDTALDALVRSTRSPWFTTYWSSLSVPSQRVQAFVDGRRGRVITDMDAETLFRRLADSIRSIEDLSQPALLSAALARQAVKRYIANPTDRIRLSELVTMETGRVLRALTDVPIDWYMATPTNESVEARLGWYEEITATLRDIVAVGCFWSGDDDRHLWPETVRRVASIPRVIGPVYTGWVQARLYPALLTLYAGGIAAVANERYDILGALFAVQVENRDAGRRDPLLWLVHPGMIYEFDGILQPGSRRSGSGISYRLSTSPDLWIGVRENLVIDQEFDDAVDRFEYLLGLEMFHIRWGTQPPGWAFVGSYSRRSGLGALAMIQRTDDELNALGPAWPPISAGLLGGRLERARVVKTAFDEHLR